MDNNIFPNNEEIFRLKVGEIVYSILKDRDLTVDEVKKLQDAIKTSTDLILAQHQQTCYKNQQKCLTELSNKILEKSGEISKKSISDFAKDILPDLIATAIDSAITNERIDRLQSEEEIKKFDNWKTYKNLGLIIAGITITLTIIQILINFW